MSSYAHLIISGREIASFRNGVEPTFMFLFRSEDLIRKVQKGSTRPWLAYEPDEEYETCEFVISARALRDRLDVLGIGQSMARETLRQTVVAKIESLENLSLTVSSTLSESFQREADVLRTLTYETYIAEVHAAISRANTNESRVAVGSLGWLTELWDYHDPRIVLRALVDACPAENVTLDVTDLEDSGWLEPDVAPQEAALENFSWAIANGAPAIILAEGKSDVRVLEQALRLRQSHLDGFLRFADFTFGAEGGASSLVRTIRTLASAGIANRVVAIFDNDTAAADARKALDGVNLPWNIIVMSYPPLALARYYPTMGPTGVAYMDVNGLAGSIELYLGEDLLRGVDGELRRVQWTGYVPRMGRYQGELIDKGSVLKEFEVKAALAREDSSHMDAQDWSGLDAILDSIREVLATTVPIPARSV